MRRSTPAAGTGRSLAWSSTRQHGPPCITRSRSTRRHDRGRRRTGLVDYGNGSSRRRTISKRCLRGSNASRSAAPPRSWAETDWPRGLRERIEPSEDYLEEVLAWFERVSERWLGSVEQPTDLDEARPVHLGDVWPVREIVAYTAAHWAYHAGEINVILANRRREAWEYGEHVEENHISTIGHSVRRPWVTDEQAERAEKEMRRAATGSVPGK